MRQKRGTSCKKKGGRGEARRTGSGGEKGKREKKKGLSLLKGGSKKNHDMGKKRTGDDIDAEPRGSGLSSDRLKWGMMGTRKRGSRKRKPKVVGLWARLKRTRD